MKRKGFTLIELVIVIAILGILAGIAIPRFLDAQASARGAKLVADLRTIDSACILFQVKEGRNAASMAEVMSAPSGNTYLAGEPVPPTGTMLVMQLDNTPKEFTSSAAVYGVIDGRGTYTSVEGTDKSVEWYLGSTPGEYDAQRSAFIAYMNEWIKTHNGGSLTVGAVKAELYAAYYYQDHPEAVERMSDEYKQQLNDAGLAASQAKINDYYWWTYPVTNAAGDVLYNVTYANNVADPHYWTDMGVNARTQIGMGYAVIVNGKTYVRPDGATTIQPGSSSSGIGYPTEAALETALINAGYKVADIK